MALAPEQLCLIADLAKLTPEKYLEHNREFIAKGMSLSIPELDALVASLRIQQPQRATTLNWHDSSQPVEIVETPFIVEGLIYQRSSTALIAKPKCGKSTLVMDAIEAIIKNTMFLARKVTTTNVLYVTEQLLNSFQTELRNSGLVLCGQVTLSEDSKRLYYLTIQDWYKYEWKNIVELAAEKAQAVGSGLVVFDTLSRIARVKNENDASEMQAAVDELTPLHVVGSSISIQHERKAGGDISDAGRGTNAMTGAVDVLLRLNKMGGAGRGNFRMLEFLGRFPGPAAPLALCRETTDEKSRYKLSDGFTAKNMTAQKAIQEVLGMERAPMSVKDIMDETELKRSTVKRALAQLVKDNLVKQTGSGVKDDAFMYEEAYEPAF